MQAKDIKFGTVSKEEREWNRYYRETMTRIGYIPKYITTGGTQQNTRAQVNNNSGRYSTNYETEAEFLRDKNFIAETLEKKKRVPKELVDKVEDTMKELELYI